MSSLSEGWYKDPADPSTQRWWDGEGWLGKAIPADQTPPDGPPPAEEPEPPVAAGAPPTSGVPGAPGAPGTLGAEAPVYPPPSDAPAPGQSWGPPPVQPPPGWAPPGGQFPPNAQFPPGAQFPPSGPVAPGYGPPPGWVPTPQGWQPPPGWTPPPGWMPPGALPYAYLVPTAHPHGFALAGLGRRLVARLIDVFLILVLNVIVNGWFAHQWWLEVAPIFRDSMNSPFGTVNEQPSTRSDYLILTMLFVATALWFAYEVPSLANGGQTLGKRLLRVKVFRLESTEPLGFGRAFRRWARLGLWTPLWSCYGLGLLLQAIDSLSPAFDPRLRQALHDKTAHTVVVAVPAGYRTPVSATEPPGGEK